MGFDYYVYEVTYCGFPAYIGSGTGSRYDHARSGKSHNKSLNKLYLRHELLGEPALGLRIIKKCKTKQSSLEDEKKYIRKLKPLFNSQWNCSGEAKILSKVDYECFDKDCMWLADALRTVEGIGEQFKINPNLIFTPFGFKFPVTTLKWDTENYNVVEISLTGRCNALNNICDISFDHKDNVVLKIKPDYISLINQELGYEKFLNNFDCTSRIGKPMVNRERYDPNHNGASVPTMCEDFYGSSTILARTINIRRKVKIVCSVKSIGGGVYGVFCMNNSAELYVSRDLSNVLEYYRRLEMVGDNFATYIGENKMVSCFCINGCMNYESGEVYKPTK